MAVVHRSRSAGLVYGLGRFLGDSSSPELGDYNSPELGDYATDAQRRADGWTQEEIDRQNATDAARLTWDPMFNQSAFTGMTEAEKTMYAAGQGVTSLANVGYNLAPGQPGYDPVAAAAALKTFQQANAGAIANVTQRVQDFSTARTAANAAATDYVARSGGDLATWFSLVEPGAPRYSTINGSVVDNALLQYQAAKSGGQNVSALDASAADAQAASDSRYQYALTHGGFSTPETNPNATAISQTVFGPVTTTASQPTVGTTADGKVLEWNPSSQTWVQTGVLPGYTVPGWPSSGGGSNAFGSANTPGGFTAPQGPGGGGAIDRMDVAGGVEGMLSNVPGGLLGVAALVGLAVFASSHKRRR